MRYFLATFALLCCFTSSQADGSVLTIQGDTTYLGNCIPFGNGSDFGPYAGFVYKNIPAFSLSPGDVIAFDLGRENDLPISMNIAIASALSNGSYEEDSSGFTQIVSNGTPADPNGDTVLGNFELAFTVDNYFNFAGGGLLIRFEATGAFANDTSCEQVLVYSNAGDASDYFVGRFYFDNDGSHPWEGSSSGQIGHFQITNNSTVPEPSTWLALVGLGLCFGFAGWWRRKCTV